MDVESVVTNRTTAILSWMPPHTVNGALRGYSVTVVENRTRLHSNFTVDGQRNTAFLEALTYGTTYSVSLKAFNR